MFAFILQSVLVKVNLESGAIQSHAVPFDVTSSKSVFWILVAGLLFASCLTSLSTATGSWLKFHDCTWNKGNIVKPAINNTIVKNIFLIINGKI